jgi:membrane peptidoglycan carboxypeptidase
MVSFPPSKLFGYIKQYKRPLIISVFSGFTIFFIFWTQPVINPSGTVKIWDRHGVLLYQSSGAIGSKLPVKYRDLPKYLIDAAITSEDATYWTNPGIDPAAIARSFWLNLVNRKIVSGGSTITQQLARAAIISPGQIPARNLLRKIREIIIALRLTGVY